MPKNTEIPKLGELDWSASAQAGSLSKVFEHAMKVSQAAKDWYVEKHPSRRVRGRALRITAIALGVVGTLLPIITEITSKSGQPPTIAPGWTAVALVLAASCGLLDQFLGYSNAWMRYIVAEQRLDRHRLDFEYAWNELLKKLSVPPTEAQVVELLTLARENVKQVEDIMERETAEWVTEFRGALADAQRSLTAKQN